MSKRIRSFKRDMLDDEKVASLDDAQYRLWTALILLADDHGRFRCNPRYLCSTVWWAASGRRDPDQLSADLDLLSERGLVTLYSVDGQPYGTIRNWAKHQRVDNASRSELPPPPPQFAADCGELPRTAANCGDLTGGQESSRRPVERSEKTAARATRARAVQPLEGRGQERTGQDRTGESARAEAGGSHSAIRVMPVQPPRSAGGLTAPPEHLELPEEFIAGCQIDGLPDPQAHVGAMLEHARSKGKLSADWLAELRLWLLRERNFESKARLRDWGQRNGQPVDDAELRRLKAAADAGGADWGGTF
jgi:hypothetical protein